MAFRWRAGDGPLLVELCSTDMLKTLSALYWTPYDMTKMDPRMKLSYSTYQLRWTQAFRRKSCVWVFPPVLPPSLCFWHVCCQSLSLTIKKRKLYFKTKTTCIRISWIYKKCMLLLLLRKFSKISKITHSQQKMQLKITCFGTENFN